MQRTALVLALSAIVVAFLASTLRPDTFYVGDSGVKLVATRNALLHPSRPLQIDLPRIATEVTPHVEPFFLVHGEHAHAVTSELFPLLSALFLKAFGMRGLYVIPALGFLGTLAACARLGSALDSRRSGWLIAATAALGTPFLFYGLEFWEHSLSLAIGVAGSALFVEACDASSTGTRHWKALVAGLLWGTAMLLRPEAACFVVAVLASVWTLSIPPSWPTMGLAAGGALVPWLPVEGYAYLHFGSLLPTHIATNAATLGSSWASDRIHLAKDWLLPSAWQLSAPTRLNSFISVAPATIVALAFPFIPARRKGGAFLLSVAVVSTLLVLASAPNDGGGQWGPRYLLFAYAPVAVCAAEVLEGLRWKRGLRIVTIALCIVVALWVQRGAYRQLRGTKNQYGRLVDFVARSIDTSGVVVTDVWWLDQVAAAPLGGHTVLFAGESSTGAGIIKRLGNAATPSVTLFRSREESTDMNDWSTDSCYIESGRDELDIRTLVAIRLRYRC